jgi:hypothetical protein
VIFSGWSVDNVIQARSAPPITIFDSRFFTLQNFTAQIRPDVVSGIPVYLVGTKYPGGRAINPSAFTEPPTTPPGCIPGINFPCDPTRQGDSGRNSFRAFGSWQWDFAVHRNFSIREDLTLQFRAELFNVVNHPNFAPPIADINNSTQFGLSTQTLGQFFTGNNIGSGAFNPLYQIGGPRSMQFGLKLQF